MYATVAVLSLLTSTSLPCSGLIKRLRAIRTASNSRQLMCQCSWGPVNTRLTPSDTACPLYMAPQPKAEASVNTTVCLDTCSKGTPARRSNMRARRCHMPQEPLKKCQCDRHPAFERIQAVQHRPSSFLCEACCLRDRIQLHTEKRDPLHGGEFALFPVDLKTKLAKLRMFSDGNKGPLRDFREDARRQGQPEGKDLVLICSTIKHKEQKWPVSRENRDMKVRVLQVDCCKPISGQGAQKKVWLHPRTVCCCPLATEEEDESGEVSDLPLLSVPSWVPEIEELLSLFLKNLGTTMTQVAEQNFDSKDSLPGPPLGQRSSTHLRVAHLRGDCFTDCSCGRHSRAGCAGVVVFLQGMTPLVTSRLRGGPQGTLMVRRGKLFSLLLTAENCWAQSSTVLLKRPPCQMGASRKRTLTTSRTSARPARGRFWTIKVDIVWPRACAVT
ncbi:hypothetical protein PO909_034121 [Leuciscus waleckii]